MANNGASRKLGGLPSELKRGCLRDDTPDIGDTLTGVPSSAHMTTESIWKAEGGERAVRWLGCNSCVATCIVTTKKVSSEVLYVDHAKGQPGFDVCANLAQPAVEAATESA